MQGYVIKGRGICHIFALLCTLVAILTLVPRAAFAAAESSNASKIEISQLRDGSSSWSNFESVSMSDDAPQDTRGLLGIALRDHDDGHKIEYRIQDAAGSWSDWISDGERVQTKSGVITAVQVRLSNGNDDSSVWFRTHLSGSSWNAWVKGVASKASSGEGRSGASATAGTIDGLQVQVLPSGAADPQNVDGAVAYIETPAHAKSSGGSREVVRAAAPAAGGTSAASGTDGMSASVSYRVHVQTYGTQGWVSDGETAGTTGQKKRLEALWMKLNLKGVTGGIQYRVHVQTYGTQNWVSNGNLAGTTGRGKRLEVMQIRLTGNVARYYDVYYRAHVQGIGWQNWVKNDSSFAGTEGRSKRIEALEVVLVRKGATPPRNSSSAGVADSVVRVEYRSHVQRIGWQNWVRTNLASSSPTLSGTQGKGLRLEAVQLRLRGVNGGIRYKVHVQRKGWQNWVHDGASAGTTGSGLRLEAIQIELTGDADKTYDVYYRVHAQTYGWLGWAKDGEEAGTSGLSKRLEALEVVLVPKGSKAPGSTGDHYRTKSTSYVYIDAGHGWGSGKYDSGALGCGYQEADLTKDLATLVAGYAENTYGLKVFLNSSEKTAAPDYRGRQADAKARGCTSLLSIHFNAGGGSGYESYIHSKHPATTSKRFQTIMHQSLSEGWGGVITNRGMKSAELAVVSARQTGIPATLLEICFIDNSYDMKQYQQKKNVIARQLAKGLYEASKEGF